MSEAKVTTDHDEIRGWVEARGGHPARVKDTDDEGALAFCALTMLATPEKRH